jgi:hypothetical protein
MTTLAPRASARSLAIVALLAACGGAAAEPDAAPSDDCDETALLPPDWSPVAAVADGALDDLGGGVIRIDASGTGAAAGSPYLYVDLDAAVPSKVAIDDVTSFDSTAWDLGFKRYVVRSNGGDSGPGGVEVAIVPGDDLDAITAAPPAGDFAVDAWATACAYTADPIGGPLTPFSGWYAVDAGVLTPLPQAYVVRTRGGDLVALDIRDYYADPEDAGRSAVLEIAWRRL